MESYFSASVHAFLAVPGYEFVRHLLDDPRVPFLLDAAHFGAPVQAIILNLCDLLDSLHEPGELLELCPLVVGCVERNANFDGLLNSSHGKLLSGFTWVLHLDFAADTFAAVYKPQRRT